MADRHASGSFAWPGHLGVRSSLSHGRIARVLFCVEQECMVLLHGFMKKTQKTAKHDIDLAIKRKKGTTL
jgi:phage-related protein